MNSITTHVLDTALGRPADGIAIALELYDGSAWKLLGSGVTDADGRLRTLLPAEHPLEAGRYRITFATGSYHARHGQQGFYPEVCVVFDVRDPTQHYHVPLLLSPFGFSTYRGSLPRLTGLGPVAPIDGCPDLPCPGCWPPPSP